MTLYRNVACRDMTNCLSFKVFSTSYSVGTSYQDDDLMQSIIIGLYRYRYDFIIKLNCMPTIGTQLVHKEIKSHYQKLNPHTIPVTICPVKSYDGNHAIMECARCSMVLHTYCSTPRLMCLISGRVCDE